MIPRSGIYKKNNGHFWPPEALKNWPKNIYFGSPEQNNAFSPRYTLKILLYGQFCMDIEILEGPVSC